MRPQIARRSFVLAILVIVAGCDPESSDEGTASSADSASVGVQPTEIANVIRFDDSYQFDDSEVIPNNGESTGHRSILETLGSGVALTDFDGDSWPDLMFAMGGSLTDDDQIAGSSLKLFRNSRGAGFVNCSDVASVTTPQLYSHGLFATDFDQDGCTDVLVTGYGKIMLFHNLGDGTFQEVAEASGLHDALWSTGAAWGDVNQDGLNDLYVANYVNWSFENHPECEGFSGEPDVCSPANFDAQPDYLFLNDGAGRFTRNDAVAMPVDAGKGLAVLSGDVDIDGDLDFYVANDTTPNFLFLNDGAGRLKEAGISSGTAFGSRATADGSMGLELADLTLNGRPDIWVTNYEHQNFALYRNDSKGVFQHVSDRTGISSVGTVFVGFGTAACDFDLDGDEDLFVANGHVMQQSRNSPLRQRPLLFCSEHGQQFANVGEAAGKYFSSGHRGRGVASGDLNGDGRTDLVITHCNDPAALLINTTVVSSDSVNVRLVGVNSARRPIGAYAQFKNESGSQSRFLKSGASFLSSGTSVLSFTSSKSVPDQSVRVFWPSGSPQDCQIGESGSYVIVEGRDSLPVPR